MQILVEKSKFSRGFLCRSLLMILHWILQLIDWVTGFLYHLTERMADVTEDSQANKAHFGALRRNSHGCVLSCGTGKRGGRYFRPQVRRVIVYFCLTILANIKSFLVFRMILAMGSSDFQSMFYKNTEEVKSLIHVPDVVPEVFRMMLK